MAPARWPPARPACCHSHQGNLALQLPQFYSGVIALFAGRGGGASCQAQWSLNPKAPPAASWSSSPPRPGLWLAGRLPSKPHNTHWLGPSSPGLGPLPPSPHRPEPSCHASLQLQLPTPHWLGTLLVSPPRGLGSTQLQHQYILMRKRHQLAQPVCAFKSASDFQILAAESLLGAMPSAAEGIPGPAPIQPQISQAAVHQGLAISVNGLISVPQIVFPSTGPSCFLLW